MSKRKTKNELSRAGEVRKETMLGQLQDELVSVHGKRRQRNAIAKGVALAALMAIAGVAWALVPETIPERIIAEAIPNVPVDPRPPLAAVSNIDGISERCLVSTLGSSAKLETVSDDEVLALLSTVGTPSVLGEIDGRVRIIPVVTPKRKKVKAL